MKNDRREIVISRMERSRDALQRAADPEVTLYNKPGLARAAAEKASAYMAFGTYMKVPGTNKYAPVVHVREEDQKWMIPYLQMKGVPAKAVPAKKIPPLRRTLTDEKTVRGGGGRYLP